MQVFVMINNVGIVINAGVNVKNQSIKVGVMIDVFRILVHVNTNMISRVILENTWITRIVNAERERG